MVVAVPPAEEKILVAIVSGRGGLSFACGSPRVSLSDADAALAALLAAFLASLFTALIGPPAVPLLPREDAIFVAEQSQLSE